MASMTTSASPPTSRGPAWAIATLFPDQGQWSEGDYLGLDTNHLVEFSDGYVEVLPMPKPAHQRIVLFIYSILSAFVARRNLGEVLVAPMPVRLRPGKYREPDVVLVLSQHDSHKRDGYWENPDLVMEVVSDDPASHNRDYEEKRLDYAEAGVGEYWIVDPQAQRITVLRLSGGSYVVHGEFSGQTPANSHLLAGFQVSPEAEFAAAKGA
jgi:Uma2 family endonuclease